MTTHAIGFAAPTDPELPEHRFAGSPLGGSASSLVAIPGASALVVGATDPEASPMTLLNALIDFLAAVRNGLRHQACLRTR